MSQLLLVFSILFLLIFPKGAIASEFLFADSSEYLSSIVDVPNGNIATEPPRLPSSTLARIARTLQQPERKYERVVKFFKKNKWVVEIIKDAAETYSIDPIHLLGAIVGEHTFNVGLTDTAQGTVAAKALATEAWTMRFESKREEISLYDITMSDGFNICANQPDDYEYWLCIADRWTVLYLGEENLTSDQKLRKLKYTFFSPLRMGFTYGLGQMGPLRALMVSDLVESGYEKNGSSFEPLTIESSESVKRIYKSIIDTETGLYFLAATLFNCIDAYRQIARFNIDTNPGITSTLYNLGDERGRATRLREINLKKIENGEPLRLPQENYYGRWINENEAELRELLIN